MKVYRKQFLCMVILFSHIFNRLSSVSVFSFENFILIELVYSSSSHVVKNSKCARLLHFVRGKCITAGEYRWRKRKLKK